MALLLHLMTLLVLMFQGFSLRRLSRQKPSTLVQLVDGNPLPKPMPLEREPAFIKNFVRETMLNLFTWPGPLPSELSTKEQGIPIKLSSGNTKFVAPTAFAASFALAEAGIDDAQNFRISILQEIANLTPSEIFDKDSNTEEIETKLSIRWISDPQEFEAGKWIVRMIADLEFFRYSEDFEVMQPVKYNKEFLIRAIDTPEHLKFEELAPLQRLIYQTRQSGLEIYEIRSLCLTDKYNSTLNCPTGSAN